MHLVQPIILLAWVEPQLNCFRNAAGVYTRLYPGNTELQPQHKQGHEYCYCIPHMIVNMLVHVIEASPIDEYTLYVFLIRKPSPVLHV